MKFALSRRVLLVLCIDCAMAFVLCMICGFAFYEMPDFTLYSVGVYKFQQGVLLFFKIVPAVLVGGMVIGYSWAFGREKQAVEKRFSSISGIYLRSLMLIALGCTVLSYVCTEIGTPAIKLAQKIKQDDSDNVKEYLSLATQKYADGDFNSAMFYTQSAIELAPKYKPALELQEKIETEITKNDTSFSVQDEIVEKNEKITTEKPQTVTELMEMAETCFKNADYINAHFYASQVLETASQNDANRMRATKIAAESWTKLSETSPFDSELSKEVYETKREGYSALVSGDYSKAYYTFSDLMQKYPLDFDIKKYYAESRTKLLGRCFFMDETENLQQFEKFKDVHFSIKQKDGGKDIISIGGITAVKSADRKIMYFRDFSVASYDKAENILYTMHVPYAKMCAAPLSNMSIEFQEFVKQNYKTLLVPYVFLKSVDRTQKDVFIEPEYTNATSIPEFPMTYTMPISLETFSSLCDVSKGEQNMALSSLFLFSNKVDDYGYSSEVFTHALLARFSYPFILLIFFLYTGIIAYHTRLFRDDSFRVVWIMMFPIFTFLAYVFIKIAQYFIDMVLYALLGTIGKVALPVSFAILVILIFIVAIRFVALKR